MDANLSEVTVLDVFLLSSAKIAIPVFGGAAADAGIILETCQAPIQHAPGLRYIAEETPCSDICSLIIGVESRTSRVKSERGFARWLNPAQA